MRIRAAQLDDLEAMRQVERRAGEPFRALGMAAIADDEPPTVEELAAYQRSGRAWVATDGDEVVAYLIFDVHAEDQVGAAHVEQVSVDPRHARRRIGQQLIEAAAGWATEHGLPALTLTTFADVPWNAPYYARLGFEVVPEQELTADLLAVRRVERERGLDRWPRVAMVRSVRPVRRAYLDAAQAATTLLGHPVTGQRWEAPSLLPGMSVGALAAHVARSILQVEWFLDAPPRDTPPVTAAAYYARLDGTAVPHSPLNTGVRARSDDTARQGWAAVAGQAGDALRRLRERLPREPAARTVTVTHHDDEQMLLDEYLATRCVELAVHLEDLSLTLGLAPEAPTPAVRIAVEVLVGAARARHGDVRVLRALARRERDDRDALRVL